MYDELADLAGEKVVHIELWEDALGDTIDDQATDPTEQIAVDMDLYLDGGIYFELYGVICFPDPDAEPLVGFSTIAERLTRLVKQELWLDEVAVDEENTLVFILSQHHQPQLYLMIDGWSFAEWDELPSS
ncbi:MAG: hypothetical protein KDE19_17945 [Caldilineaceae bacterium]|nr:hypothetical protein [Caldilineaceae bacterium]